MTHTPAPWLLLPNNGGVYALDENNEVNRFSARIDGGHEIYWRRQANVTPTSDAELAANARLIAAAPELLEALQELEARAESVIEALDKYNSEHGTHLGGAPFFKIGMALAKTRTAIAKAIGA